MASPCALAVSKIVYPETEKSAAKSNELQLEKGLVNLHIQHFLLYLLFCKPLIHG